jgi:hypothetical protein
MSLPTEKAALNATPVLSTSELTKATECKPDLMPFHIEYDGPAPVCTYMKVEGIQDHGVGKSASEDVDMENGGEGSMKEEREGADEAERYVSTFRGRTIHGTDVRLPAGYSGLVLRGGGKKKKGKEEGKSEESTGKMTASGIFSLMRVWGPDVPVDAGQDKYIRGLEEWTSLGSEVSRKSWCKNLCLNDIDPSRNVNYAVILVHYSPLSTSFPRHHAQIPPIDRMWIHGTMFSLCHLLYTTSEPGRGTSWYCTPMYLAP